jgi:HSP20 family protein
MEGVEAMNDKTMTQTRNDTQQQRQDVATESGRRDVSTAADNARKEAVLVPPVDVIEDPTAITLYADMPGVPRDKLNLRIDGDSLLIEGDLVLDMAQGMQASHAEIQRTHYRRAFALSRELDTDKVTADLTNGVLKVRIPKAEHAQPRRISVQAA